MDALGTRLAEELPVHRVWVGTRVLHPQAAAYLWIWTDEVATVTHEVSYALFYKLDSRDSPVQRLRKGAPHVRFTLTTDPEPALHDVAELWNGGFTDLFGLSVHFRGDWMGGVTWATRQPEGFSPEDIALLEAIQPTLSAVLEPLARDMMFATLLRTYLGDDAGRRVAAGQVRRGDQDTVRAAVWFSDVRGFTQLSAQLSRPELLGLLDDVFEAIVVGCQAHGGQVLKFMGDGVLVVFVDRDVDHPDRDACDRASQAADDVQQRLAVLRTDRQNRALAFAEVGIGLHYGEVTYGNIGAPSRLDFTVIGPAVNLAARVEGLCGGLGRRELASEDFASRVDGWTLEGTHALKGVAEPVSIFRRST
jgi:adenylate cyclase